MLGTGVEWKKYRLSFGFWVTMTTNSMCPILSWNTKPFLPFAVAYAWRVSRLFLYMLQMCDWARLKYIELETTTATITAAMPDLFSCYSNHLKAERGFSTISNARNVRSNTFFSGAMHIKCPRNDSKCISPAFVVAFFLIICVLTSTLLLRLNRLMRGFMCVRSVLFLDDSCS